MKSFLLLLLLFSANAFSLPTMMGNPKNKVISNDPVDIRLNRKFHGDFMLDSPRIPGRGYGVTLEGGLQDGMMGYDARLAFGSMHLNQFFSPPTETEIYDGSGGAPDSSVNPDSEINRARSGASSWSYWMIGPGMSVTGRLFSAWKWSQTARFGVSRTYFNDSANSLSFAGWLFSADALFRYHFAHSSGLSAQLGLSFNTGWITRTDTQGDQTSNNTLPVLFVKYIFGVRYSW